MTPSPIRLLPLIAALALTGCNPSALLYKNDHRLSFQSPGSRQLVATPVDVRWTMKNFDPTGLDGSTQSRRGVFALFVDRAPMPVGKDLRWLARNDVSCIKDPQCPDANYLSDHGVVVTTQTSVTLETLPLPTQGVGDEEHYVTVVLLNGKGQRIGESAWYRPFTSKRRTT